MLYENEDFKTISSLSSGHFYHFHYIYCKVTDGGILVHDAFWYLKKGSLMILKFLKNNCGKRIQVTFVSLRVTIFFTSDGVVTFSIHGLIHLCILQCI